MARDSSPLSKRLKALAVRAGLPVDAGTTEHAAARTPPDDEQPTGEFPAVTASDAPEDDLPTGEFPAVATVPEPTSATTEAPSSADGAPVPSGVAVPPPLREEPATQAPSAAPIWTDSPAEEQSPLTAGTASSGPTLPPPTLSRPQPSEPATNDSVEDEPGSAAEAPASPDAEAPLTELHALAEPKPALDLSDTAVTSIWAPVDATAPGDPAPTADSPDGPPSRAADLNDALALAPEADDEPSAPADAPATATSDSEPATQDNRPAAREPESAPSLLKAVDPAPTPTAEPAGESEREAEPEPEPEPTVSVRDRLSLTGRFAALRRKVKPADDGADDEPRAADGPSAEDDANGEPPTVAAPVVTPAAAPPMVVDVATSEPHPTKPSFSERAALRRRAKTLRARRDTGLLELGAIVLDQRRFGDPTAGALLRRRTDELADLDQEIASIEHALESHASAAAVAALGAIRCVGCSSLVGPTERYCSHCGTPRPVGGSPSPDAPAPAPS